MLAISSIAVALIVAGLVIVILTDIRTDGAVTWIGTLREWQTMLGTLIGFATAAGILALSTAFQQETTAQRNAEATVHAGHALAVEARSMNDVLQRVRQTAATFHAVSGDAAAVGSAGCSGVIEELDNAFVRSTPIYDSIAPKLADFGDPNLALFVNFYATHSGILRDADYYVSKGCPPTRPEVATQFMKRLDDANDYYQRIAKIYGIN
ncbi:MULTISPECIES: hypothetical protein [unclassified Mesorhizobium]|jgi:hypothetical protein|uniref:hypothetical protein n=1 Tax=unclassified Mesorhizobium TaxID=325217 RepID=UPI0008F0E5F5|nr:MULTISPECIES: hypothetical protein [unclassified Mesorhizobium]RJG42826.1 hypothetical protein D3Y55_00075 [Mesorhizobium sp. DCY119]SFU12487.1 hypothetical protein SAMN05518861_11417 [Mesorhizobium sp. YR577]